MKKFKAHTMYDKSGKAYKANTYEQHLDMQKKGSKHSKPDNKKGVRRRVKKLLKKKTKNEVY